MNLAIRLHDALVLSFAFFIAWASSGSRNRRGCLGVPVSMPSGCSLTGGTVEAEGREAIPVDEAVGRDHLCSGVVGEVEDAGAKFGSSVDGRFIILPTCRGRAMRPDVGLTC